MGWHRCGLAVAQGCVAVCLAGLVTPSAGAEPVQIGLVDPQAARMPADPLLSDSIRLRLAEIEARLEAVEAMRFSPTTTLKGQATVVLGANRFGGTNPERRALNRSQGATTFNADLRLHLNTSFNGRDLLRLTLREGNFAYSGFGNAGNLNTLEAGFGQNCRSFAAKNQQRCDDDLEVNRLYYQAPWGDFHLAVGAVIRQDDMLAMWPSVYPGDAILDVFTYAGAAGVYNKTLGSGAGLWFKKAGFSVSLNLISANANVGNPGGTGSPPASKDKINCGIEPNRGGGIGSDCAYQASILQLGYSGSGWGVAAAYTIGTGGSFTSAATPAVLAVAQTTPGNQSLGLSGYWQPLRSSGWPSISAGWGGTRFLGPDRHGESSAAQAQSWFVGLQWLDVLRPGYSLGLAVGQPTFLSRTAQGQPADDATMAWEGWYRLQISDRVSITPAVFYLSEYLGQLGRQAVGQAAGGSLSLSNLGALVKTTIRF